MGKIYIKRNMEYANMYRGIYLYANGKLLDRIMDGEVKEFFIPNGKVALHAMIDFAKSKKLHIEIQEDKPVFIKFWCTGNPWGDGLFQMLRLMFKSKEYLQLKEVADEEFLAEFLPENLKDKSLH